MSEKSPDSGQAGVEITSGMVEAGVSEFLSWEESDDYSAKTLVRTVYLAMRRLEYLGSRKDIG